MKKLKISFPQIVIENKVIEVTDDQHDEILNGCEDEKADFIWSNMTDQEQSWTNGKKWISDAVDAGYSSVKNES